MIGITLGDPTGVGAEVTLKALASELERDDTKYLLFGDLNLLSKVNHQLSLNLPISPEKLGNSRVLVANTNGPKLPMDIQQGGPQSAEAALEWLSEGARRCLKGEFPAIVTAPLNKEAVLKTGRKFVGQTEFLSEMAGTSKTAMMLLGDDPAGKWIRVVLVTTHLPLRQVADEITASKVDLAISLANQACIDLQLGKRRIGVCGLNPHAGEGGELGREEIDVIAPCVVKGREAGLEVTGPVAADTLFYYAYKGDFEVVVAMYHDQGLAPLKMIGFEQGINWTLGLPFIRTSPDHGTAYNIAGKGIANPSSMVAAIRLAKKLSQRK